MKRNNELRYAKAYEQGKTDWSKGINKCSYKSASYHRAWVAGWLGEDLETFDFPDEGYIINDRYILHSDGDVTLSNSKLAEFESNRKSDTKKMVESASAKARQTNSVVSFVLNKKTGRYEESKR